MMDFSLRRLKDVFCHLGASKRREEPGDPFYNASEINSLKQQAKVNRDEAIQTARAHGVKLHPRVAAIREKAKGTPDPSPDSANAVTR
jgi:hypothetical protein